MQGFLIIIIKFLPFIFHLCEDGIVRVKNPKGYFIELRKI